MSRYARLIVTAIASLTFGAHAMTATAGAPKEQRISHVTIDRDSRVHVTVATSGAETSSSLAQVRVASRPAIGRSCRRTFGERLVADAILELGLDQAVRLSNERRSRGEGAAYLYQPEENGQHDSASASLNRVLIDRGIARVARERGLYRRALRAAERSARRARRGIWACSAKSRATSKRVAARKAAALTPPAEELADLASFTGRWIARVAEALFARP